MIDLKRSRIVLFESPIQNWKSEQARNLFCKIVALKREGYGKEFPENILPLDATDFYGTHLMICEEDSRGNLDPFVAYKSVSNTLCDHYRTVFPALSGLRLSQATRYEDGLKKVIAAAQANGGQISYDSAWTMKPEIRRDKELSKRIRDIMTMIGIRYHQQSSVTEWITCGVHRFKTNEYFEWMGCNAISGEYSLFTSNNEKVTLYHMNKPSQDALDIAHLNEYFWKKKRVLANREEQEIMKDAA